MIRANPTTLARLVPRVVPRALPRAAPVRWYSVEAPADLDSTERDIFSKLATQLEPEVLNVRDVSGGCGSMFAISIESKKFNGLSTIKQHRLVNEVLSADIKQWHGLQLKTKAVE